MSIVVNYIISMTNIFNHSLLDSTLCFELKKIIYTINHKRGNNTLTIMISSHIIYIILVVP
jgi:hypothetical protein